MEGLPQSPGVVGLLMIVLGLAAGGVYVAWVRRTRAGAPPAWRSAVTATLVLAGAALALSPYVVWRGVEDIRYTSGLDPWLANRYGVSEIKVHPAIFDAAAGHMPEHARYYLATPASLDSTRRQAFEQWAAGWLLPRVAVASPRQAGWILTLGVDPSKVGVPIERSWRIWPSVEGTPPAYLGEVRG